MPRPRLQHHWPLCDDFDEYTASITVVTADRVAWRQNCCQLELDTQEGQVRRGHERWGVCLYWHELPERTVFDDMQLHTGNLISDLLCLASLVVILAWPQGRAGAPVGDTHLADHHISLSKHMGGGRCGGLRGKTNTCGLVVLSACLRWINDRCVAHGCETRIDRTFPLPWGWSAI